MWSHVGLVTKLKQAHNKMNLVYIVIHQNSFSMNDTVFYACILVSFVGSVESSMPESFKQAIAATHVKMEQFLREDSKVDPNRHCDWMLVRDNKVMDTEGKYFVDQG